MVKSLTIGLVDDGVATWNPVSDGNLLVTGGAGCGKTWWLTGLAAQAPPFKAGVSRLYVSLVLYILLHDGEWGAAYGGDEVAVGPQGGDPAFE